MNDKRSEAIFKIAQEHKLSTPLVESILRAAYSENVQSDNTQDDMLQTDLSKLPAQPVPEHTVEQQLEFTQRRLDNANEQLNALRAKLVSINAQDAKDAARYRFLREKSALHYFSYRNFENGFNGSFAQASNSTLDKYIDAAMQAKGDGS